jgi:AraC-like DNA-binding protein
LRQAAHSHQRAHVSIVIAGTVRERLALLCRAIAAIAAGQGLADAAHGAGFADQSHLSRAMRATFGVTPRRLLRKP